MSAQLEPAGARPAPGECPLCGGAVGADADRCHSCGFHLGGVDGRPGPFDRAALLWITAAFLLVYAAAALVVLAAR